MHSWVPPAGTKLFHLCGAFWTEPQPAGGKDRAIGRLCVGTFLLLHWQTDRARGAHAQENRAGAGDLSDPLDCSDEVKLESTPLLHLSHSNVCAVSMVTSLFFNGWERRDESNRRPAEREKGERKANKPNEKESNQIYSTVKHNNLTRHLIATPVSFF